MVNIRGQLARLKLKWQILSKRKKITTIASVVMLLLAAGGLTLWQFWPKEIIRQIAEPLTKKEAPKTKPSPLTGVEVAPELADRPITAVVVENHPNARPQSGLAEAGVVYEALAEGGITRFLSFYLESTPKNIGPIRSLRTYFVSWALEFDAPVAHAGGNADALDIVGPLGMKDLNQFAWGPYFRRVNDRYAPHNLYSSMEQLDKLKDKLGYSKPPVFKASPRKADSPAEAPTATIINIAYSYPLFGVRYDYDKSANAYLRSMNGLPHKDRESSQQIAVKNIVVMYMPTSYGYTRIGEQTVLMSTVGSGKAVVLRDGVAITGTWKKPAHKERAVLLDAEGLEIPLNAGNTWYSIVPPTGSVTY